MSGDGIRLRLYVAGDSGNSRQALANLQAALEELPKDGRELDVVDVFNDGRRALADGVLMTPQLLLLSATPVRRLVGNLEDRAALERFLGLQGTRRP